MTHRTRNILTYTLFVATLLWGGFSLMTYLGIPVHQLVYQTPEQVKAIETACGSGTDAGVTLCRGFESFFPFIRAVFAMGSPFFAYVLLSVLIFGGLLLWCGYKTGYFRMTMQLRPLMLIGLFCVSVWLLATTMSLGTLYNLHTPENEMMTDTNGNKAPPPFRRFIEPTAAVYGGAGTEALAELQNNYQDLRDRGCLIDTGLVARGDAKVYDLTLLCMQESLFARAGIQVLLLVLFLLNLTVLGSFLIVTVVRLRRLHPLHLLTLSLGVGALGWSVILWTLSLWGWLHQPQVWVLFLGMPLLLYRQTWWWLQRAWADAWDVDVSVKNISLLVGWLLLTYLALNFLNVVRPFPIGWDDLGSYLNRPRLLASYGSFIPSMSQFQWEYLTSLGFVLLGYDSAAGSTFAMQINWSAGLMAVLAVYVVARTFLGRRNGLIAAMAYYFLPMTGHFSFADMKIDNASFFTGVLAFLAVSLALFPAPVPDDDQEDAAPDSSSRFSRTSMLLLLAGLLAGFNFSIKATGILTTFFVGSMMGGAILGPLGFAASVLAGFVTLRQYGPFNVTEVLGKAGFEFAAANTWFMIIVGLSILVLLVLAVVRMPLRSRQLLIAGSVFVGGFAIVVLPWMVHNASIAGAVNISSLLSARDTTAPQVFYEQQEDVAKMQLPSTVPVRFLPPDLKLNADDPACKTSARVEELDRYWGTDGGISHYLGLPWRQVMNIDAFGYYVTLVPALLLCILLLFYGDLWEERYERFHLLVASIVGVLLIHASLSLLQIGWYLGFVSWLLSIPGGVIIAGCWLALFMAAPLTTILWRAEYRWLGILFAATWVFLIQWALVANGVMWYGIGMFLGFAVILEALVAFAPDASIRWLIAFFFTMSILVCLVNRFWQFDTQKNLFEYPLGKVSAAALRESTIPDYNNIRQSVEERRITMPDRPYTYRIGTFISYFIPKNREVFPLADHQMGFFNCINQERDHALTLRRLQALGFNGIIFDTNTQTIEKDPNGSLHQKVSAFMNFVNDASLGLQVAVNDPGNGIAYILLP